MQSKILNQVLETLEKRQENYDPPEINFERIATGWNVILDGKPATAEKVALCMVWLKICREVTKHTDDNILDGIGYWVCEEQIIEAKKKQNGSDIQTQDEVDMEAFEKRFFNRR